MIQGHIWRKNSYFLLPCRGPKKAWKDISKDNDGTEGKGVGETDDETAKEADGDGNDGDIGETDGEDVLRANEKAGEERDGDKEGKGGDKTGIKIKAEFWEEGPDAKGENETDDEAP